MKSSPLFIYSLFLFGAFLVCVAAYHGWRAWHFIDRTVMVDVRLHPEKVDPDGLIRRQHRVYEYTDPDGFIHLQTRRRLPNSEWAMAKKPQGWFDKETRTFYPTDPAAWEPSLIFFLLSLLPFSVAGVFQYQKTTLARSERLNEISHAEDVQRLKSYNRSLTAKVTQIYQDERTKLWHVECEATLNPEYEDEMYLSEGLPHRPSLLSEGAHVKVWTNPNDRDDWWVEVTN